MSWLSRAWDHNRNTIGNVAKDVSPFLALTPLGPLGSAGLGALGAAAEKGSNFGSIAKSGLENGALGYGASQLAPAVQGWLSGGAGGAGAAPSAPAMMTANGNGGYVPSGFSGAPAPSGSPVMDALRAAGGGIKSAGGGALDFLKSNALPIGQAAGGILQAREQGANLDFQKQQYADQQALRAKQQAGWAQLLAGLNRPQGS